MHTEIGSGALPLDHFTLNMRTNWGTGIFTMHGPAVNGRAGRTFRENLSHATSTRQIGIRTMVNTEEVSST